MIYYCFIIKSYLFIIGRLLTSSLTKLKITGVCSDLFEIMQKWCLSFGCCARNTIDWMAYAAEVSLPQFWRPGSPRARCWSVWFLVKVLFLICRWLPSGCALMFWEGEYLWVFLPNRALIPFTRAPPSGPNNLPKAPPPHTIILGLGLQYMTLGGTQFIADRKGLYFIMLAIWQLEAGQWWDYQGGFNPPVGWV